MKKIILLILVICILPISANAAQLTAPEAPQSAQAFMPDDTETFAEGLWHIIKSAISTLQPSIAEASKTALAITAAVLFISIMQHITGAATHTAELAGVTAISLLLLQSTKSLILLGSDTILELSEYEKLLLPIMTAALSSQGYATTSAALYTGTLIFNTVLTSLISKLLIPMVYIFLCLAIADSAIHEDIIANLKRFTKWLMTWGLKIILYTFTGYITITGVISGSADATAVKAAKIAINGVVPVVGGILSDASEAVLVSAGTVKNAVGIYGLFAILSLCISPFLRIGIQYLILKLTAAVSGMLGSKKAVALLSDFTSAMGIILAMTGTVCLLILISTVCFMKGAA